MMRKRRSFWLMTAVALAVCAVFGLVGCDGGETEEITLVHYVERGGEPDFVCPTIEELSALEDEEIISRLEGCNLFGSELNELWQDAKLERKSDDTDCVKLYYRLNDGRVLEVRLNFGRVRQFNVLTASEA